MVSPALFNILISVTDIPAPIKNNPVASFTPDIYLFLNLINW